MATKHWIAILRKEGFNCFPIPHNQKKADNRYKASRTTPDQAISNDENYGYIPIEGAGTAILDFDNKEQYRTFAKNMIKEGHMVVETGNGWHIPVKNLSGSPSKIELFDYSIQDSKIIEIQGPNHYCVGPGSEIFHDKLNKQVVYTSRGTETIWDAKGIDFHDFVDGICKNCNVESNKKNSRSSYKNMRDRFLAGKLPTKGQSNNYFFQAAMQCNTDGLTENEALEKIKLVYDKWALTNTFSDRPWSNIEVKIRDVYENNKKLKEGRPKSNSRINRTAIAQEMIAGRTLYSDIDTRDIFENKNGFLEKINNTLLREMMQRYPEMEQSDYNSILFKLAGLSEEMPPTNKNLIVFRNGVFDKRERKIVETDDVAESFVVNFSGGDYFTQDITIYTYSRFSHFSETVTSDSVSNFQDKPGFVLRSLPSKDKAPIYDLVNRYVSAGAPPEMFDVSVEILSGDGSMIQTWEYRRCDVVDYATYVDDDKDEYRFGNEDKSEIRDALVMECGGFSLKTP